MPRLLPSLFRQARAIDQRLSSLLHVCRDLRSAQNELRWLTERVADEHQSTSSRQRKNVLTGYVKRRARGEPLQYILGSEYFGDLQIRCRPGVLIPRAETAASVTHLLSLLSKRSAAHHLPRRLRVLDLCTGSGCIPLLFHHGFYSQFRHESILLDMVGVDISQAALKLSNENLAIQLASQKVAYDADEPRLKSLEGIKYIRANVMRDDTESMADDVPSVLEALRRHHGPSTTPTCDIVMSNPPYISTEAFRTTTSRSVRHFEPRLALVPESPKTVMSKHDGDAFYAHLIRLAEQLDAKVMLLEVADMDQALRVARMVVREECWTSIEIWRDNPAIDSSDKIMVGDVVVKVRGAGHGRSVFAYRGAAAAWVNTESTSRP